MKTTNLGFLLMTTLVVLIGRPLQQASAGRIPLARLTRDKITEIASKSAQEYSVLEQNSSDTTSKRHYLRLLQEEVAALDDDGANISIISLIIDAVTAIPVAVANIISSFFFCPLFGWLCGEDPVDLCATYPCGYGDCIQNGNESFTCDCFPGWSGDFCDSVVYGQCPDTVDETTDSVPCAFGTCDVKDGKHVCVCSQGFEGDACDEVNEICSDGDENIAGVDSNGYRYELYNNVGTDQACMSLNHKGDLSFSGNWSDAENMLARRGIPFNRTQTYAELGTIEAIYDVELFASCDPIWSISSLWRVLMNLDLSEAYQNSFISVYGWTVDPLIEFYVVESSCTGVSSSNKESLGVHTIDGVEYEVMKGLRVEKPSILGDTTFQQIFSIRRSNSNAGRVAITKHFELWDSLGVTLSKFYEVSFVIEGINNSGTYNFSKLELNILD